jgi:ABC-2 type transport system permease protein
MFALVALITAFACGAIGALIGVVSANAQATMLWSQLIFLPSMLIGGLMMPLSFVPEVMRPFSALLPAAHAMQAFDGLAYDRATVFDPTVSLIVLFTSGLLAFGLAVYLFNWDSKNQSRRGHPLMALLALAPFVISIFFK